MSVRQVVVATFLVAEIAASPFVRAAPPSEDPEVLIRVGNDFRRKGDNKRAEGYLKRAYEIAHTPRSAAQLGLDGDSGVVQQRRLAELREHPEHQTRRDGLWRRWSIPLWRSERLPGLDDLCQQHLQDRWWPALLEPRGLCHGCLSHGWRALSPDPRGRDLHR
jgi:hypothetical protein